MKTLIQLSPMYKMMVIKIGRLGDVHDLLVCIDLTNGDGLSIICYIVVQYDKPKLAKAIEVELKRKQE